MLRAALLLIIAAQFAVAGQVTWFFHDVYADGSITGETGYIWGDFVYDTDTTSVLGWHLFEDPIPQTFPDAFEASGVAGSVQDSTHFQLGGYTRTLIDGRPFQGTFYVVLATPITEASTEIALLTYQGGGDYFVDTLEIYGSLDHFGEAFRPVSAGYISTSGPGSAPEPATLVYALPAFWFLVSSKRRQNAKPTLS
jgi:hypothetical protein